MDRNPVFPNAALLGNPTLIPFAAPMNATPVSQRVRGLAPGSQPADPNEQGLIQNPVVSGAMDKAWADSNPDSPGYANKHEQGGWIRQNSKGDIWVESWPQGPNNQVDARSLNGHHYLHDVLHDWPDLEIRMGGLLDRIIGALSLSSAINQYPF
jgi:hypothetical protein